MAPLRCRSRTAQPPFSAIAPRVDERSSQRLPEAGIGERPLRHRAVDPAKRRGPQPARREERTEIGALLERNAKLHVTIERQARRAAHLPLPRGPKRGM